MGLNSSRWTKWLLPIISGEKKKKKNRKRNIKIASGSLSCRILLDLASSIVKCGICSLLASIEVLESWKKNLIHQWTHIRKNTRQWTCSASEGSPTVNPRSQQGENKARLVCFKSAHSLTSRYSTFSRDGWHTEVAKELAQPCWSQPDDI